MSYSKGKEYPKYFVYIPIEVARDSAFPFQEGEEVEVIVDMENKRLIVEKSKDSAKPKEVKDAETENNSQETP